MKKKFALFGKSILIFIGFFISYIFLYSFFFSFIKNFGITVLQIYDLILYLILSIGLFFLFKNEFVNDFKNLKNIKQQKICKYILIYIMSYILSYFINIYFQNITHTLASNEIMNRNMILSSPIIATFSLCILAPFYEEILVRLNFKNLFQKKWLFIIITGIFFASLHLLSIERTLEFLFIIPYAILGITLSYIYRDSQNIYLSIFFHAINNAIGLLIVLYGGF